MGTSSQREKLYTFTYIYIHTNSSFSYSEIPPVRLILPIRWKSYELL